MILSEYQRANHDLKKGDCLSLLVRGNYGDYEVQGYLVKMENGRVYLMKGESHHYLRIRSMTKIPNGKKMLLSGEPSKDWCEICKAIQKPSKVKVPNE